MQIRRLSKEDYEKYIEWRRAYNALPEVKEKNKQYMGKYLQKPGIREKIRKYNREYMRNYWAIHPEKYAEHAKRTRATLLYKRKMIKQAATRQQPAAQQQRPTQQIMRR